MAAIEPGSEDLNDLAKAHEQIRRCVSGIQQFRMAVLGVYGPKLPPLVGLMRPPPPVTGPRVDELQRVKREAWGLVSAGRDMLQRVGSELSAARSGPVGAYGVYGPNAHDAVLNLAEDLLHDPERARTLDPAELSRLWAEAEREYHAMCRNRRIEGPVDASANTAPGFHTGRPGNQDAMRSGLPHDIEAAHQRSKSWAQTAIETFRRESFIPIADRREGLESIRLWLHVWHRLPGATGELTRRAEFITRETADNTDFAKTREIALAALDVSLPPSRDPQGRCGAGLRNLAARASSVDELRRIDKGIDNLFRGDVPPQLRRPLEDWQSEVQKILVEAERIGVAGAWLLANPSELEVCFTQGPCGPGRLAEMRLEDDVKKVLWVADSLVAWVRENPPKKALGGSESPVHSDDFRSVNWFGTEYTFTPTQAACVKVLWENWERGTPEVGDASILERANSESDRLDRVFKGQAAWGAMIVAGTTKGTHRLNPPGD